MSPLEAVDFKKEAFGDVANIVKSTGQSLKKESAVLKRQNFKLKRS